MISDFVGAAGSSELSVTKGQQVEVLEMSATAPDYCLVRMAGGGSSSKSSGLGGATNAASGSQPQEGLVPMAILKPPPTFNKTSPRRTLDLENSGMCVNEEGGEQNRYNESANVGKM